jgi:hypothetical protein
MRISNLTPQKYKRFFAFGCSYTSYMWPTWADIIGQDIPIYLNWGSPAAGNHFIFNSIVEADSRYHFNKDDLVIVMWTFKEREDRYNKGMWMHDTNRTQKKTYGKGWFKKFGDDLRGFLIRDLGYIVGIQETIKKSSWEQFCVGPLTNVDSEMFFKKDINKFSDEYLRSLWISIFDRLCEGQEIDLHAEEKNVLEVYKNVFPNINKSFIGRWSYEYDISRELKNNDLHPTPLEALSFIDSVWPNNSLSSNARAHANQWSIKRDNVDRL